MNTIYKPTLVLLAGIVAATALADRTSTAITNHKVIGSASEATIDGLVADGYRLFDIEIDSTNPYRFTGSLVKNDGVYQKGWYWTANKTHAELATFMSERNARMIDMEIVSVNGQNRYAGTFIKNEGADFTNWKAVENRTWAQLQSDVSGYNGRIIDLDAHVVNGSNRFDAVIVKNTGSFYRQFTYFSGRTTAQINALVQQTGFQLIDIERQGSTTFAGVLERNPGVPNWFFVNRTWQQLQDDMAQYNARAVDVDRFTVNGSSRYNYVLINNCNALETRVGQMMRTGSDGKMGFYVRQVGGPRLGQLMADYRFYPASTIKMLEHMYWSWRVQNGLSQNTNVTTYPQTSQNDIHANNETTSIKSLIAAQQNMMYNSSNVDANALQDAAGGGNGVTGRNAIMSFAENVVGLDDDIQLNHKLADGGMSNNPYNMATGREYGLMMEKATDGSIYDLNGFAYLRANMLNETFNSGFRAGLRTILNQEGALAGKSNAQINNYWSLVRVLWKGGNNGTTNISSVGHAILPKNENGRVQMRQYVLSAFIEGATNNTFGGGGASNVLLPELLREQIRAGIQSW